jgi:hypothetical protein
MIKEEFEDTRGTIRICKSKDRQHNSQAKKGKRTNNDLQEENYMYFLKLRKSLLRSF